MAVTAGTGGSVWRSGKIGRRARLRSDANEEVQFLGCHRCARYLTWTLT